MPIQYIQDDKGYTTAVIIPIEEWKDITSRYQDLKELDNIRPPLPTHKKKPSDFAGKLSQDGYKALNEHIKQARSEWDRDSY